MNRQTKRHVVVEEVHGTKKLWCVVAPKISQKNLLNSGELLANSLLLYAYELFKNC